MATTKLVLSGDLLLWDRASNHAVIMARGGRQYYLDVDSEARQSLMRLDVETNYVKGIAFEVDMSTELVVGLTLPVESLSRAHQLLDKANRRFERARVALVPPVFKDIKDTKDEWDF